MAEFKARPAVRWDATPGEWRWRARAPKRPDIWRAVLQDVLLVDEAGVFIVTEAGEFLGVG